MDVIFYLAVSICKGGLFVDGLLKIRGKTAIFGLGLNYFGYALHHCLLYQLGCGTVFTGRSDLEVRTFVGGVVVTKILIEPNSDLSLMVYSHHGVRYFEDPNFFKTVFVAPVGFAEEVESFWEYELGEFAKSSRYSFGDDFESLYVAAEWSLGVF